jgi:hypothetical protein
MTTAEVLEALAAERPLDRESGPWTVRFIQTAQRQFGDRWRTITLDGAAALDIILPPHKGEPCRGDRLTLVKSGGARVREAAATLAVTRADYAVANASCWNRINAASMTPFSTLILTTAPLDSDDHRGLESRPGALYHLDGFHRLVGWALAGRLIRDVELRAIVAGEI